MTSYLKLFRIILPMLAVLAVLAGCQSKGPWIKYKPEPTQAPPAPTGTYLDFDDVQIPARAALNRDESYIYQTENVRVGVLVLTSSLPMSELVAFFQENMARDNWRQASVFTFHKTVLLFEKKGKNCLILLNPAGQLKQVRVEIWVSPVRPQAGGRGSR